jgi:hypothetical protein
MHMYIGLVVTGTGQLLNAVRYSKYSRYKYLYTYECLSLDASGKAPFKKDLLEN